MDLHDRLAKLRSFIWWTIPLYGVFLVAGLASAGFVWTVDVGILVGLLVAFGCLDGMALAQIRSIEAGPVGTSAELEASRARVNRLAKALVWGGAGFAALFLAVLLVRLAG